MSDLPTFSCSHKDLMIKRTYSCNQTGNYTILLCLTCSDKESKEFLVSEERIS